MRVYIYVCVCVTCVCACVYKCVCITCVCMCVYIHVCVRECASSCTNVCLLGGGGEKSVCVRVCNV